jgi:hypothetical protein
MGEIRNAYKDLAGKCEEKIPLGRPRLIGRWDNNVKMNHYGNRV